MNTVKDIDTALADQAIAQVRTWLEQAREEKTDAAGRNLAGVLSDPKGLDFATGFVDGVVRPEDLRVAARNFRAVARDVPSFLPMYLRALVRLGGLVATIFPPIVVPLARRVLRQMVRHLIVDASDRRLGPALARIGGPGTRLNVNLLGEAILGQREADRRVAGTIRLIERSDIDYMSIKVSSTVAPHSLWAHEQAVTEAVDALEPVYRAAVANDTFLNLDMEEYKDLDLTLDVFQRVLDKEEFQSVRAGIVLQAYLPDCLAAMVRLQEWAAERVASGGSPVKVRIVKGANLPMEEVDADTHGWPLATWPSKQHTDAGYKQVLEYALHPDRIQNVHLGIAGHNLFDVALAKLLAESRGITEGVEFEMLLGMATQQAAVVRRDVGELLLYTPVVHPQEFDVAIAYLIRRLEEGASPENFMSAVFDLDSDERLFQREKARFLTSIDMIPEDVPEPNRTMDRRESQPAYEEGARGATGSAFRNTPDSDPSLEANRDWASGIRERMQFSRLGIDTIEAAGIDSPEVLDDVIAAAEDAGWRELPLAERVAILHRAGDILQRRRGDLLEVMGSECGKVIEQGDPEVSEAIDFAHYYALSAERLEDVDGASFTPARVTAVIPPWNFPAAIPAGGVLAALAAGSSVIFKPARQASRTGAVIAEALWEAGVPREAMRLVRISGELGSQLLSDPRVERAILTGAYETAELFRSFRRDLPLLAETSGKNAIIVTPSADYDLAAKDIAYSAFGHAGQKCSAASLVVVVGSVATSERFRRQLLDAIDGYEVGYPWQEGAQIGPVIAPAEGKLLRGLTTLEQGQRWLIEPRRQDESGALWSPGIRVGVEPGSEFHLTEYFGPVAGIIEAATLEDAIEIVNEVEYGLTSGLHSLDPDEIQTWLGSIQAGNAYINRAITGAIVERQSFGGWKKSAVGPGTKAGGPSYLYALGEWADAPGSTAGRMDAASRRAAKAVDPGDQDRLEAALATDIEAFEKEFGAARDVQGLSLEQNVLRYVPTAVTVRFEGSRTVELVRVVAAGARIGAPIEVSSIARLPEPVRGYLADVGAVHRVEDAEAWSRRAAGFAETGGRIRLVGASADPILEATEGSPNVAVYAAPVTSAGRVEMLPFVREQAVSITAHRFGNPRRYEVPVVTGGASDLVAR